MTYVLTINGKRVASGDTLYSILYDPWRVVPNKNGTRTIENLYGYDKDGLFTANRGFKRTFVGSAYNARDDRSRTVAGEICIFFEA